MSDALVRYGVLGPITVTIDGARVDLGPPRQRALLAMLLTEAGRVVPVERVIELLWRGEPPDQAMGTVHSYVSNLRRALEPGRAPRTPPTTIVTRPPGYVVAVPPGELDAREFEQLAAAARASQESDPEGASAAFDQALSLWRGPAYEEFGDELFALAEVRRLEDLRLTCLEDKFDAELALGRHVGLAAELERAVEEHPLRERLRGQLLLALYRSGRQADALRSYEEGRRRLVDELGLEPGHDLRRLERAILDHDLSVLATPASPRSTEPAAAPTSPVSGVPPATRTPLPIPARTARASVFVGRQAELERLRAAWEWVREGSARLVAVAGEAGIGKTRLVSELAQYVHDAGGSVLWGRSTPEPLTSYQPFVEALSPLVDTVALDPLADLGAGRPALARLFPDSPAGSLGSPHPGFEVDRYLLFDAIADLISAALDQGPVLLVLDDMHWADPSTAALLVHVLRSLRQRSLLVVSTHRDTDVDPDHPIAGALHELRRDHLVAQVPLTGLDEGSASSLVRLLAGSVDEALAAGVHRRTEGNPFFIEEVVSHALDTGDWELEEGRVPKGIRDILERRLNLLGAEDQRVLAAAAVLGREFELDLLSEMIGADEDALVDVVERAARSNLLVEPADSPGRLSFAHALIREVLLDRTMAVRLRRLHRTAAEAIERNAGSSVAERSGEIAHHLLAAGAAGDEEAARTASFLSVAATRSLQVSSYDEAVVLCRQALEVLGESAEPGARIDLLLTLGAALLASGDLDASRRSYFEAADEARQLGDGVRLAAAATGSGLGTGIGVSFYPGRLDEERVELLEQALALLTGRDPALEVWVLSYLVVALQDAPFSGRRIEASLEAEALAARLGVPRLISAAAIARRLVLATPDIPMEKRIQVGQQAIEQGDLAGEMPLRIVSRLGHLIDLAEAGDLAEYDRVLREVDELVGPLRQRRWRWFVDTARAGQVLAAGRYHEAEQLIEQALVSVGKAQGIAPLQSHGLQRLLLERDLGQPDMTVERLSTPGLTALGGSIRAAAMGLALVESGDLERAAEEYHSVADERFKAVPRNQYWLITLTWLAETAIAVGDVAGCERLQALFAGKEDRLVTLGGGGVSGSVARISGLLAAALGQDEEAASLLERAIAAHEDLDLEPWTARTAAELAVIKRRLGDTAAADALRARADEIAERIGLRLPPDR